MNQRDVLLENPPGTVERTAADLTRLVSAHTVIRAHEPLAKRTTLRVGGPADLYVEPGTDQDLCVVVKYCSQNKLRFFVLGRGSNLLIGDGGFRGLVLCLAHPHFSRLEVSGRRLVCGAGARMNAVAAAAKRHNLAGLEFLEGIPGSIGGALRMNAGAMGGALFDVVRTVRLMSAGGDIHQRAVQELDVTYRACRTFQNHIALSAVLEATPGTREAIEHRMQEFSQRRWKSQPAAASAGCIFKNPASIPAGRLIDELGLKGTRVGGAMVSFEHGNFLVNDGTATAKDFLELIQLIRAHARKERGIELETEVQIIGA